MWHGKNERRTGIFRGAIGAAVALLIAQGAPAALARGAGGAGTSTTITLTMSQAGVWGGDSNQGKVKLSQPAPAGGVTVHLGFGTTLIMAPCGRPAPSKSSVPASMPDCVNILAGATSATFTVATINVKTSKQVKIIAQLGGSSISGKTSFLVNPVTVYFAQVPSGAMDWGSSSTWAVMLSHVPKKGATVVLGASGVKVPASVKVLGAPGKFTATAPTLSPCSMSPSSPPVSGKITATWEGASASAPITVGKNTGKPSRYTSNTIRIDPYAILGVSHDAQVVVLKSSVCANSLVGGDVMFIKKLGVLKVGAVKKIKTPSPEVAVGVSSASLTDFINDGTLQILKEPPQTASEPGGSNSPGNPWADTAEPYDEQSPGEQPWKYTASGTAKSYSFTAFKENNGLSASVSGKGEVDGGYNFLVVIHSDKLQQATFTVPTDGTLDVEWMAQTTASGQGIGESRLRMAPLYSGLVDDKTDDIPFLFQIYANLIFKPGFGEKAAAKGHFTITYKGEGGIDGSSPVNNSLDATPDISSTTSSAKAPHGAVVAINAPKFAMTFSKDSFLWAVANRLPSALNMKGADFADGLEGQLDVNIKHDVKYPQPDDYFKLPRAAYVQWVASVAYAGQGLMGAGLFSPVPCQQYYQNYLVQAGIDKDMLGSISGSIPPDKGVEVFKKTGVSAIPSIQGCMPKK
ncbi:MAG: hypothetical protein ACYDD2_01110 [Candidatus Acidiferrales bacterium]